jgi:EpsI family protein
MNKRLLVISAVIFLFALYLDVFPLREAIPLKKAFSDFPLFWNGWSGKTYQFDNVTLEQLRVNEYVLREYRKGGHSVTLYVGYYGTQRAGAQIHSPKHCLPGSGWSRISERIRTVTIHDAGKVSFVEAVYQKGDAKDVFIYWYKMKDAYITNDYALKMFMVVNSLRYRRNDAAFIRLSAPVTGNREETIRILEGFMKDFLPLLKDYLPE